MPSGQAECAIMVFETFQWRANGANGSGSEPAKEGPAMPFAPLQDPPKRGVLIVMAHSMAHFALRAFCAAFLMAHLMAQLAQSP